MMTRILSLFSLSFGVAYGLNACLDSSSSSFACTAPSGYLKLENCTLADEDIPDLIECFNSVDGASLHGLSLSFNLLQELSPDLFAPLSNVQTIDLDNNLITDLTPGIFDELGMLEGLWLQHNQLTTIAPGLFPSTARSEAYYPYLVLVLGYNPISELPADAFTGSDLSELSLEGCSLSEVPAGLLSGLENLDWVNLNANYLTTLPENFFAGLVSLNSVELNDNDIMTLPDNIFDGLDLRRLELVGNDNLECLPENTVESIFFPDSYDEEACETSGSTCSNGFPGIQSGIVCCLESCGECGGSDCFNRPGGRAGCCVGRIRNSGEQCSSSGEAPCLVDNAEASTCTNGLPGIQSGDACCHESCGTCGGKFCGGRPGGAQSCCVGRISASGTMCSTSDEAPCIVDDA